MKLIRSYIIRRLSIVGVLKRDVAEEDGPLISFLIGHKALVMKSLWIILKSSNFCK